MIIAGMRQSDGDISGCSQRHRGVRVHRHPAAVSLGHHDQRRPFPTTSPFTANAYPTGTFTAAATGDDEGYQIPTSKGGDAGIVARSNPVACTLIGKRIDIANTTDRSGIYCVSAVLARRLRIGLTNGKHLERWLKAPPSCRDRSCTDCDHAVLLRPGLRSCAAGPYCLA